MSGQGGDYLKAKLESLAQDFQNPMSHISHWVKGEVYNLACLEACAFEIQKCDTDKKTAIGSIASTQAEIDRLNSGKFTFGSMFKNETEKKSQAIVKA